jgi:hypothetical protein
MRLIDLFEDIYSMSELAEIMPSITAHLKNLTQARITLRGPTSLTLHTQWQQQPLTLTYQLRSGDQGEFRRQLAAALRSSQQGQHLDKTVDVTRAAANMTFRQHALGYLTNSKRWAIVGMTLNSQPLPAPKILDEYNVIGSAVRLDEIPPQYRKLPQLGRGAGHCHWLPCCDQTLLPHQTEHRSIGWCEEQKLKRIGL